MTRKLAFIVVLISFISCTKTGSDIYSNKSVNTETDASLKKKSDNPKIKGKELEGKWSLVKLSGNYPGSEIIYLEPGSGETLEFFKKGGFIRISRSQYVETRCVGSHRLVDNNILQIRTDCNQDVEILRIKEVNDDNLILEQQGREGFIQYYYINIDD